MAAKALAEYVRAERLRRGETPFELGERVLDPRHFEFRHGQPAEASRRWSTRQRPTNVLLMIEAF
jgi:hypothetical protein